MPASSPGLKSKALGAGRVITSRYFFLLGYGLWTLVHSVLVYQFGDRHINAQCFHNILGRVFIFMPGELSVGL